MSSALIDIYLSLSVIATICHLIDQMTDVKHFCLITAICSLVYWYVYSTPGVPQVRQGPITPDRRRQIEEWLHQEEFIAVIARAMNKAGSRGEERVDC